MKIQFDAKTPEHRRKSLRKALKAAHTPAANRKRAISLRAAGARRRAERELAQQHGQVRGDHQIVPLDHIPGERPPVIVMTDKLTQPHRRNGTLNGAHNQQEGMALAKALVATVYKLING